MNLFNLNSGFLLASLFWSSVGVGFTVYGRKQGELIPLLGGIALIAISFFGTVIEMSLIGIGIIAAVFWIRRLV